MNPMCPHERTFEVTPGTTKCMACGAPFARRFSSRELAFMREAEERRQARITRYREGNSA